MNKKALKAKVIGTGKKIKVIEQNGGYTDIITGKSFLNGEIQLIEPTHTAQIGFHIWRLGLFAYAREYWQYNSWFIIPGVSIDAVNGYDRYFDLEVKFLFIGLGIRFVWIKRKKFNNDFNNDFKK